MSLLSSVLSVTCSSFRPHIFHSSFTNRMRWPSSLSPSCPQKRSSCSTNVIKVGACLLSTSSRHSSAAPSIACSAKELAHTASPQPCSHPPVRSTLQSARTRRFCCVARRRCMSTSSSTASGCADLLRILFSVFFTTRAALNPLGISCFVPLRFTCVSSCSNLTSKASSSFSSARNSEKSTNSFWPRTSPSHPSGRYPSCAITGIISAFPRCRAYSHSARQLGDSL
mmetsp:Transcript_39725/g.115945  ORF Transcript_39725/g.115945 Transcript_39725/m.115945 type:complete len:226 (-) Transcript_39725:250-927(-)